MEKECPICRSKGSVNFVDFSVTKGNYEMRIYQSHCNEKKNRLR